MFPITIDLAQINLLRGRELALPSGEEYLAFLLDELGLDPRKTASIRGQKILTSKNPVGFPVPLDDADTPADLQTGPPALPSSGPRSTAITYMPTPRALRAIARPIIPNPYNPMMLPETSTWLYPFVSQAPLDWSTSIFFELWASDSRSSIV